MNNKTVWSVIRLAAAIVLLVSNLVVASLEEESDG